MCISIYLLICTAHTYICVCVCIYLYVRHIFICIILLINKLPFTVLHIILCKRTPHHWLYHLMRRSANDVTHAWISQRHHLTITCQLHFFFNNVVEQVSQDESAIKNPVCRGGRKPSPLIQAETELISVMWRKLDPI